MKHRRDPFPSLASVLEDSGAHSRTIPVAFASAGGVPAASAGGVPAATAGEIPRAGSNQRVHARHDKAFVVVVGSELYGDSFAIARNISAGGLLAEMSYAPPLGTVVTIRFQLPRLQPHDGERAAPAEPVFDEIVARAEVKHHHYLNFSGAGAGGGEAASSRAIGMRFLEFLDHGEPIDASRIQ